MSNQEDANELKDMAMMNVVKGFMADKKMNDKLTSVLSVVAVPAYTQVEKILGEDKVRYMIYNEPGIGLVIHKLNMEDENTKIEYSQPEEGDLYIIRKDDVSNLEELLKTLMSKVVGGTV